jgi:hypothetical protein
MSADGIATRSRLIRTVKVTRKKGPQIRGLSGFRACRPCVFPPDPVSLLASRVPPIL